MMSNKMVTVREEEQIWAYALRRLEQGRPGDVDHTRRVVNYGKILPAKELLSEITSKRNENPWTR